jgi:probable addiction module antidote protein
MSLEKKPYDSAEVLKTDEDIANYLVAAFEEPGSDAASIIHALGVVARAKGMSEIAREIGVGVPPGLGRA